MPVPEVNLQMKKKITGIIHIVILFCILLLAVSCTVPGSSDRSSSVTDNRPASPSLSAAEEETNAPAVSMERFESEVIREKLGILNKIDGREGYDAALVTSDDGTNYIYMYLPDVAMARSILMDSDGDGKMDSDLTQIVKRENYEIYIQETNGSGSAEHDMYGHCLLAGNTIILVNGPLDSKKIVRTNADRFLKQLGFETE